MNSITVAIDIDDVLADENGAMITFINQNYGTKYTYEDYYNTEAPYDEFWESVWGVDKREAANRYRAFLKWEANNHLEPIPGAIDSIKILVKHFKLVIVSSRNNRFLKQTEDWLKMHFPSTFSDLVFVELWKGTSANKAEISYRIGASYLIDDNPEHCIFAAELGIKSLLFGQYGWNRSSHLTKGLVRVKSWQEVLEYFDVQ